MEKWLKQNKGLVFRVGLAAIFLANSMVALVEPDEFKEFIEANALTSSFGHADALVYLIALNDGLLALAIIVGKYKRLIATWATVWLSSVIFITGFWSPDFIEHFGVIALVAYYSQFDTAKKKR